MADFQYLAPDMPDFLKQVMDADALNQDVSFHLQPPVFTRFDHPTVYNYNPEPQTSRGCKANQGNDLDEERCEDPFCDDKVVLLQFHVHALLFGEYGYFLDL